VETPEVGACGVSSEVAAQEEPGAGDGEQPNTRGCRRQAVDAWQGA
jgi:hypothetical protein